MKQNKPAKYLLNCFLLMIPPLLISFLLLKYLPEAFQTKIFWNNIPLPVRFFENTFRMIVMILSLFFPLTVTTKLQKTGLAVYLIGVALYLFSYLTLIYFPESNWGKSLIGFSAPATTPLIWFIGIGLIMDKPYFTVYYKKWIYLIIAILFCVFHFTHTGIIYYRHY
jgi:hypothetical protein